ncbi:MAG: hypothetical protein COU90_02735 [Candidatus Ryanbacteria bacterium CG10_big_fil_rev_8_21_14_0_10_43_42]|uniref:Fatty acid desaturase domain-containing protein n=1 Tax=Candidatus Ryanbacteria bacterium CG10_big_fil_rev_8_21_14_0_10_43_42 TaxID=1974864 RepID=A0A2M8KWT5_9BACT|nr:MAG: hypothetical protein COU90_02735 [Candidatus Ryanbacteria bacterium CG10_big_fil_rev_8_21_14_0_10_43_42]
MRIASIEHLEKQLGRKLYYKNIVAIGAIHFMSLIGIVWGVYFGFTAFHWILAFVMYGVQGFGTTLAYHRFFTHNSFKCSSKYVARILAFMGGMTGQDAWGWVRTHRTHHLYTDTPRDPHSPVQSGFFWAHVGWLLVHLDIPDDVKTDDLDKNETIQWERKWHNNILIGSFVFVLIVSGLEGLFRDGSFMSVLEGGIGGLLLAGFIRFTVVLQVTWCVNSVCHLWGSQMPETAPGDTSRNNGIVGLLALGEGWHNWHHIAQHLARQGRFWWQIDLTWYLICLGEWMGIFTDVKRPKPL